MASLYRIIFGLLMASIVALSSLALSDTVSSSYRLRQGLRKVPVPSNETVTYASFFYFSEFPLCFNDSLTYCRESGLELVNILNHSKQNEIQAAMFEIDDQHPRWINLWWRNGAWYWGDSRPALYTNFASNRTDAGWRHFIDPTNDYFWTPDIMTDSLFFICENVY